MKSRTYTPLSLFVAASCVNLLTSNQNGMWNVIRGTIAFVLIINGGYNSILNLARTARNFPWLSWMRYPGFHTTLSVVLELKEAMMHVLI